LHGDGQGGFTFATQLDFPDGSGGLSDMVAADVDGDGALDVVAANPSGNRILVALGNGRHQLHAGPSTTTNAPEQLVVRDVTGDGVPDVLATTPSGVVLLRGRGGGGFEPLSTVELGARVADLVVADVTGDGVDDLVVAVPAQHAVQVYRGLGAGRFAGDRMLPGSQPLAIAIGDFTGDGWLDIAVADAGDQTVRVFAGAAGGLSRTAVVTSGVMASRLARADMNGDGWADLIALDQARGTLAILLGRGDGSFQLTGRTEQGESTPALIVADFNGDRLPDVVLTAPASQSIVVGTNVSPVQVRPGDLNRDGVVTASDLRQLVAELFDGDAAAADSCGGGSIVSGAEADVNGDGQITAADLTAAVRGRTP